MIVGCITLYGERVDQALVGIKGLRPYVDRYVVIVDETVTEEQKEQLRETGCEVYFHPWVDDFVLARNHYLEKCHTDDWVIVHDPDEWFNQKFCEDIRGIVKVAEESGVYRLLINAHDILYQEDGTKKESVSDFFKNLIFRNREGAQYVGKGEGGRVHEGLIIPGATEITVKIDSKYWYTHVKYWHEVWERASRNLFIGGGGINIGGRNPSWKPLRKICDDLGLDNWTKARDYFRKGNIEPRLKEWLWDNRFEGFDYQHEMMEFGRWYYDYLHPEERTFSDGRVWEAVTEIPEDSPAGVMKYVEDVYMKILGRHAEQEGKEIYSKAIMAGQIRREDLPELIKQSPEYRQRVVGPPSAPGERIRIPVPVNVDIQITEEIFLEALKRSNVYWQIIKPKIDVGTFLEGTLGGEEWKNFQQWFYEKEPTLKQFLKKLSETQ